MRMDLVVILSVFLEIFRGWHYCTQKLRSLNLSMRPTTYDRPTGTAMGVYFRRNAISFQFDSKK